MFLILNRLRGTEGFKISFEKYGLSYSGGWELQEGFYGLMQDLVLIVGIYYVMAN